MDQLKRTDSISALGIMQDKVKISSIVKAMEEEQIKYAGTYKKPDYRTLVKEHVNLAILPGSLIPDQIKESDVKGLFKSGKLKELKEKAKEQKKLLEELEKRYTTLEIRCV